MKYFRFLWGFPLVYLVIIVSSFHFTACSKTVTDHDTTIKTIHDTTVFTDTVYDLTDGLVAYYNFINGNLNDSSGMGNNIAYSNATLTNDRFGNPNSAYNFTNGSYMRVNNSVTLNPAQITLMTVVRFNGFYTGNGYNTEIFMKGPSDASQGIYGLRSSLLTAPPPLDTSKEYFVGFYGDAASSVAIDSTFTIVSGAWNIVVYTYDGFTAKLYINGTLINSRLTPLEFNANTSDLYIGKTENTTYPYNFTGDIDEIRIYDRALTPQLVQGFNSLTR
jgi:hypothetical protein